MSYSTSCCHLDSLVELGNGLKVYHFIHACYVSCLLKDSNERKANDLNCHKCGQSPLRIQVCMSCVFFGCVDLGHMEEHARDTDHHISVELSFGNVFCHPCQDFMYNEKLEAVSKTCKQIAAKKLGVPYNAPWHPTKEEVMRLKHRGTLLQINENTKFGVKGVENLGSSCYMTSGLLALVHAPVLRNHYLSEKHQCQNYTHASSDRNNYRKNANSDEETSDSNDKLSCDEEKSSSREIDINSSEDTSSSDSSSGDEENASSSDENMYLNNKEIEWLGKYPKLDEATVRSIVNDVLNGPVESLSMEQILEKVKNKISVQYVKDSEICEEEENSVDKGKSSVEKEKSYDECVKNVDHVKVISGKEERCGKENNDVEEKNISGYEYQIFKNSSGREEINFVEKEKGQGSSKVQKAASLKLILLRKRRIKEKNGSVKEEKSYENEKKMDYYKESIDEESQGERNISSNGYQSSIEEENSNQDETRPEKKNSHHEGSSSDNEQTRFDNEETSSENEESNYDDKEKTSEEKCKSVKEEDSICDVEDKRKLKIPDENSCSDEDVYSLKECKFPWKEDVKSYDNGAKQHEKQNSCKSNLTLNEEVVIENSCKLVVEEKFGNSNVNKEPGQSKKINEKPFKILKSKSANEVIEKFSDFCMGCEMSTVFEKFYNGDTNAAILPSFMVPFLAKSKLGFDVPQDVLEFLTHLIPMLHEGNCMVGKANNAATTDCSCIIFKIFYHVLEESITKSSECRATHKKTNYVSAEFLSMTVDSPTDKDPPTIDNHIPMLYPINAKISTINVSFLKKKSTKRKRNEDPSSDENSSNDDDSANDEESSNEQDSSNGEDSLDEEDCANDEDCSNDEDSSNREKSTNCTELFNEGDASSDDDSSTAMTSSTECERDVDENNIINSYPSLTCNANANADESGAVNLVKCLEGYLSSTMKRECSTCVENSCEETVHKKAVFLKLPEVFCFQFHPHNNKENAHVNFPELLDLRGFMSKEVLLMNPFQDYKYTVYAVVELRPGDGINHYVTYIKHFRQWFLINDPAVGKPTTYKEVSEKQPYFLFYYKNVSVDHATNTWLIKFIQDLISKNPPENSEI